MGEIDNRTLQLYSEEDLLMNDIVQEDHELMFLDTYLTDIFKFKQWNIFHNRLLSGMLNLNTTISESHFLWSGEIFS